VVVWDTWSTDSDDSDIERRLTRFMAESYLHNGILRAKIIPLIQTTKSG